MWCRLAAWAFIWASGCGSEADARTPLPVYAASSLTESFEAIETSFERAYPQYDLRLNFAGSQVLRLQIEEGADAAVFASANASHIRALERAQLVSNVEAFATNELVIIVPADDDSLTSFEQLPQAARIVLGDESAPIGQYTEELLSKVAASLGPEFVARVRARVASREGNVRLVRAKVVLGEADAAIVYRSDAHASDELRIIELPDALGVPAEYFVAPTTAHADAEGGRRFVEYLRSAAVREQLEAHGFSTEGP